MTGDEVLAKLRETGNVIDVWDRHAKEIVTYIRPRYDAYNEAVQRLATIIDSEAGGWGDIDKALSTRTGKRAAKVILG